MKAYFLRHGQAEHDVDGMLRVDEVFGDGLTADGMKQVEEASRILSGLGIARIFSSDALRSKQSTEIVNKEIGLSGGNISFDKDLREMGVGRFAKEGKSLVEWKQICNQDRQDEYGAETYKQMHQRACRVLNRYKELTSNIKDNNANILFSGHGHFNSMIRYCVCEGLKQPFDKEKFEKIYDVQATNASIMMIDLDLKKEHRRAEFIHGGSRNLKQSDGKEIKR